MQSPSGLFKLPPIARGSGIYTGCLALDWLSPAYAKLLYKSLCLLCKLDKLLLLDFVHVWDHLVQMSCQRFLLSLVTLNKKTFVNLYARASYFFSSAAFVEKRIKHYWNLLFWLDSHLWLVVGFLCTLKSLKFAICSHYRSTKFI